MPYFRALLSALTFFGGHFLNRRPDRVIAVFAALAVVGVASYLLLPSLIFGSRSGPTIVWAMRAPALLILGVALASAVLTWRDARTPVDAPLTISSRIAGTLVSQFGFLLLGVTITWLLSASAPQTSSAFLRDASDNTSVITHRSIHASTHLGGDIEFQALQPPPKGSHLLRGRIVMGGKPVEDADLEVILNGKFEAQSLTTDERGEFAIRLPEGQWFINRVTVTGWQDAPEGRELLLFSEQEPAKGAGHYSRYSVDNDTGLAVDVPVPDGSNIPTFELRDALQVEWPQLAPRRTIQQTAAAADIATSAISWQPVPSANEYEIQLSSIERDGQSATYRTILRRRQAGATLSLADLPRRSSESAQLDEYQVTIYAFDAAGKLVTHSDDGLGELSFSLAGEERLASESSTGKSVSAEYFKNMERLSLIQSLLDFKQLDAARSLLNEITEDAPPGRKLALQAAIEALAGNCAAALPLFAKAEAEGGAGCAQPKYKSLCETP